MESVSALEKYFPFQLSVRDLTVEVDDTTNTVSAAPMRMLSTILKMNLEGWDCLDHIEKNTRHNEPSAMLRCLPSTTFGG